MKYDIFVYMLRCADSSYYVGSYRGHDVMWRVGEHNAGKHRTAYAFSRRPVEPVWSDYFTNAFDAVRTERQLKGWSRAKKEALIRGDSAALKSHSRRGVRPASILRDGAAKGAAPPQDEAGAGLGDDE
jgi:putative endonuclease